MSEEVIAVEIPVGLIELIGLIDDMAGRDKENVIGFYVKPALREKLGWKAGVVVEAHIDGNVVSIFPKDPEVVLD